MVLKQIEDVQIGDKICGTEGVVTDIDRETCARHTHINRRSCYENGTTVTIEDPMGVIT